MQTFMRFENILHRIGNTPIVRLNKLKVKPTVEIWGKIESVNPGGSVKDRIALSMIEDAEAKGVLTKDKIVVEASSGNTGIGLSLVCAVKGYKCMIAMPESASVERRKIMQAFGAEIILTPAKKGTDGAIEFVYDLVRENPDKYFCPDQFNNPANWQAHYRKTAPEVWAQTEGKVRYVVCGLGTTGTAMGVARYAKDLGLPLKVVGIEPYPGHKIQGLKNMKESFPPGIFDRALLDRVINVSDEEAYEMARWLAKKEGIFVGMSSGCALAGALKLAEEIDEGLIVVIFPDSGERYLSTPLWSFEEKEAKADLILSNLLSGKREPFIPLEKAKLKLYTCGPTLNIRPHLGLYRRLLTADLLKRYLEHKGYEVFWVMNFTDFDDKTIASALNQNRPLKDLTSEIETQFFEDLEFLAIDKPNICPKVSEHLEDMKNFALELMQKNKAYEKFSAVYFDVSRFPEYGKLVKLDLKTMKDREPIDAEEYEKEEPADFALLKRVHILEMKAGYFVETPFGRVRPTWHIHCACLALKYLGETFDIFISGEDLIFPHLENTRAVAKALTGKELARYYLATGLTYFEGKRLSSENRITIEDIKKQGYEGRHLRLVFLQAHYRSKLNLSFSALEQARRLLDKLETYLGQIAITEEKVLSEEQKEGLWQSLESFKAKWDNALKEDLNSPLAISELITLLKRVYQATKEGLPIGFKSSLFASLKEFNRVHKILAFPEEVLDKEILELAERRDKAKEALDYETADRIRDELSRLGYRLFEKDGKTRVLKFRYEF